MKIRCMIVDDEPLGRQVVAEYLNSHTDIEIIAETGDPQEAYRLISDSEPDLLFLDIQMPEMNGFELLSSLSSPPVVVFCTAYDEFAIKAFEASAVDYLLKPFEQDRFDDAVRKAKNFLSNVSSGPNLDVLLSELSKGRQSPLERIIVRKGERLVFVHLDEIIWIEAQEDYVRIHAQSGSYLVAQRLGHLETRLNATKFLRVHRSTIVNVDCVKELHPWSSGRYLLILTDGTEVETSKSGAKVVRELIL